MRVLYISYFYPPLGGPAALRNVKTVKYLAQNGIQCDVITVRDIEYINRDPSLLAECSENRIIRTGSLDPMSILRKVRPNRDKVSGIYTGTPEKLKLWVRRLYPIDDKIGWVPFLLKAGRKALREANYDLIYVSLGPFSSSLGTYQLSRESGLPLVIDLRDYWNLLSDYDLQATALHRRFSRYWERRVYAHAKRIVTATAGIGRDAADAFGKELADKMLTVYNGWDESDFAGLPEHKEAGGFTLAYFGNIYARRSLHHFYQAMARLREENSLPAGTRIKLYGNYYKDTLDEVARSGVSDLVEIVPQLNHRDALKAMRDSDALILLINAGSPRGTLTSKVFEYLRAQRPIVAMVPDYGEAAELLRENGHNLVCAMESAESIQLCLKRLFSGSSEAYRIPWVLERASQVKKLADRLNSLF
jgi:glycosyltransferase involved in cell wall biosynthesis